MLKKSFRLISAVFLLLFSITSCTSTPQKASQSYRNLQSETAESSELSLLFAGDIMAHNVNHNISDYSKIWAGVKSEIESADLAFGNIESPIDQTKPESSYPNFNLPVSYIQAAIDAGFDVFSLANNHSFDQFENGISETIKSAKLLESKNKHKVYFSGLKKNKKDSYSYNIIEKNDWKILFLPVTELLNYPHDTALINYENPTEKDRKIFLNYIKQLRKQNPCDLFIISMHANEPEYIREVTEQQRSFYLKLLETADIIWANHAHLVKNREFIFDRSTGRQKLIMYANGNTISGQRTRPDFENGNSEENRDNTGDGLFYKVVFKKHEKNVKSVYNENGEPVLPVNIVFAKPFFITTYINTAYEFIIKPLNDDFVEYLKEAGRNSWAAYIQKRIKINNEETKDLITWQ